MAEAPVDSSALADFLRVVRRRKWIVVQTAVVVPIVAVVFSVRKPELYDAGAQVLLNRQNQAATLAGVPDISAAQDPDRYAQTQAFLARSPALAEATAREAKVPGRTGGSILAASNVSPSSTTDVLSFRVTDADPAVAVLLVNLYAKAFTDYRRALDTQSIQRARKQVLARMASLRADGKQDTDLYTTLDARAEQLSTTEALQRSNAFVARYAGGAVKIQPTPKRDAILGLGLGIVLGIGLAFLRDTLDTRLRTVEEIGARLHLPLLGRIAAPPKRLRDTDEVVMLVEPNGVEAEMFRLLRTSFELVNLERQARSIMITSALEGEGKTTTAANLAVALARAGKRVVLVDLDLRRPAVNRFFRIGRQPGLTDVALHDASLEDALVSVELESRLSGGGAGDEFGLGRWNTGTLEVLPSGPPPPDPGEFVGTHALEEILDALKQRADYVLLDTPPMLQVGDAMALSTRVDGILVVSMMDSARRAALSELRRLLEAAPAEKIGFVATGTDATAGYESGQYAGRPYVDDDARRPVA